MAQVFVSYKRENISKDFIKHLRLKLEEDGFDVWIDTELLLPGEDWKKEIDNAIKASIALIVIMTPEARKSEYITYEWAFAIGREIPVLPIVLQETELHPRMKDLQFVDFSNAWGDGVQINFEKLIAKLRLEVDKYEKQDNAKKILPAIQRVTDEFNNPDKETRGKAMQNLSSMLPNEAAMQALCDALINHPYPDIREAAAYALSGLKRIDLTSVFAEKLNDDHEDVVRAVIQSLHVLETNEAFQLIMSAFAKQLHFRVKISIIRALTTFARLESVPLLISALEEPNLRLYATVALGKIGTEECRKTITDKHINSWYPENEVKQILGEFRRLSVSSEFLAIFQPPF